MNVTYNFISAAFSMKTNYLELQKKKDIYRLLTGSDKMVRSLLKSLVEIIQKFDEKSSRTWSLILRRMITLYDITKDGFLELHLRDDSKEVTGQPSEFFRQLLWNMKNFKARFTVGVSASSPPTPTPQPTPTPITPITKASCVIIDEQILRESFTVRTREQEPKSREIRSVD